MQREKYKPFHDIWLLNAEGRIIFEHRSNKEIDPLTLKLLFESLSDFAGDYFQDEITNFKLGGQSYTILKTDKFLFIGSSKFKTNTDKIKQKLYKVLEDLRKRYS